MNMSITKTTKVDYKLKDVSFDEGELINEDGEVIDLINDLQTIFKDKEFTLTVSVQNKNEYTVDDFAQ